MENLKNKETWTDEDYQSSLEYLRDNQDLAYTIAATLAGTICDVLRFQAGWLEEFQALPLSDKQLYQDAFKRA